MINFRIIGNQACHFSYFYSEQNVQLSRVTTDQIGKRQSFVADREGNIAIFIGVKFDFKLYKFHFKL